MNLQGHGGLTHTDTTPKPATPAGHGGHHRKSHKPVHHDHHVKRPVRQHHRQTNHRKHKSAPRNSLPVTTLVQAMQWYVLPALA